MNCLNEDASIIWTYELDPKLLIWQSHVNRHPINGHSLNRTWTDGFKSKSSLCGQQCASASLVLCHWFTENVFITPLETVSNSESSDIDSEHASAKELIATYPQALRVFKALQSFSKIQGDSTTFQLCIYLEEHLEDVILKR